MNKLLPAFICLIFYSCTPDNVNEPTGQRDGYAPVYASQKDLEDIGIAPARAIEAPGKIYAFRNYIFQNELNKGIHIVDNSNRNQPKKTAFLKVPMSTEIAIKGNFLYTNNIYDLVVFDCSDISNPRLVKRVKDVFPSINQQYPPVQNSWFECPDPSKGIVIRWERKMIQNPKCRR